MSLKNQKTIQRSPRASTANASASNFDEIKSLLQELAAETEEFKRAAGGSITDVMADWVASQYLLALRQELAALPQGPERFKLLRHASGDVAALQRGGHRTARLQLDREKLELDRQKFKHLTAAAQSETRKMRDPKLPLSDEDRRAIVDKVDIIMGLK
jgi:hypothetical protein